jgi:hypothetical protein
MSKFQCRSLTRLSLVERPDIGDDLVDFQSESISCQEFYVISRVFRPWKDRRGDESDCHGEILKINIRLPDQNCCPNEA